MPFPAEHCNLDKKKNPFKITRSRNITKYNTSYFALIKNWNQCNIFIEIICIYMWVLSGAKTKSEYYVRNIIYLDQISEFYIIFNSGWKEFKMVKKKEKMIDFEANIVINFIKYWIELPTRYNWSN